MKGVIINEVYEKQVIKSMEAKTSAKRINSNNTDEYSDNNFKFIAGYTSGGAPYGIPQEEIVSTEICCK